MVPSNHWHGFHTAAYPPTWSRSSAFSRKQGQLWQHVVVHHGHRSLTYRIPCPPCPRVHDRNAKSSWPSSSIDLTYPQTRRPPRSTVPTVPYRVQNDFHTENSSASKAVTTTRSSIISKKGPKKHTWHVTSNCWNIVSLDCQLEKWLVKEKLVFSKIYIFKSISCQKVIYLRSNNCRFTLQSQSKNAHLIHR